MPGDTIHDDPAQALEFDLEHLANEIFKVYEEDAHPREAAVNNTKPYVAQPTPVSGLLFEITGVIKPGPLTKDISLSEDRELVSDGSACVMSTGFAWRERANTLAAFGDLIDGLPSHKAILLGALREGLPDPVR